MVFYSLFVVTVVPLVCTMATRFCPTRNKFEIDPLGSSSRVKSSLKSPKDTSEAARKLDIMPIVASRESLIFRGELRSARSHAGADIRKLLLERAHMSVNGIGRLQHHFG